VVLGDNIIEHDIREAAEKFQAQEAGAHILLKEVQDAERFGVAEVSGGKVVGIEEKPKRPKSNLRGHGIYMYDASVFDKIRTLVPSHRGELEITDVNNAYIEEGNMTFSYLQGWWTDAGTFESLLRAANLVAQSVAAKAGWCASDACSIGSPTAARIIASHGDLQLAYPENPRASAP
jgi:glucose-1-phosphate thymidylyltransferase